MQVLAERARERQEVLNSLCVQAGEIIGPAYAASYILAKTENTAAAIYDKLLKGAGATTSWHTWSRWTVSTTG